MSQQSADLEHPGASARPAAVPLAAFVWSFSALAFGFAFFQRVAPSVMVPDLMAEFAVSGAVLGQLSALYFYPYAILQLPIGALLDRYGARIMLGTALIAAAAGTALFAYATHIEMAYAGRFLIGTGSAVGFIGSMALAAKWFQARYFAFLAGGAMFFAMMCGMAGQAPLAYAVEAFGWRETMLWSAGFAFVLSVLTFIFVRNAPAGREASEGKVIRWPEIWQGLVRTVRRPDVWTLGFIAMSMSGPMLTLGGLWGVPYLSSVYGLDRPTSAFYTSMSLFGWAVGAPLFGWLSDRIGYRKLPLMICTGLNTAVYASIALLPGIPVELMAVLLFLGGMFGGCMVVSFALAREITPAGMHGSVTGLVNGLTVAAGAVLQPIVGWLLDLRWDGTMQDGARIYGVDDYRFALLSLVIWACIGFLLSFRLVETRCKPIQA